MKRGVSPRLTFLRGFTLTELAIVLFIVALLLGSMMLPLSTQDDIRKTQETQRILAEAREALVGFAVANGRLPCPATAASIGLESFAAGGSASNGSCSNFYDGLLPAAQLGLGPVNGAGLLVDSWNNPIRYAVWSGTISGTSNPLTRTDGIRTVTMTPVASATLISVCSTSTGIVGAACAPAGKLADSVPTVLFSTGKNGGDAGGADEAVNQGAAAIFVTHEPTPSAAANGEFDDIVVWLSPNVLFNRMVAAGKLP